MPAEVCNREGMQMDAKCCSVRVRSLQFQARSSVVTGHHANCSNSG